MPEPDYQGYATAVNALSSPETITANVTSLNNIQQQGAQQAAGAQIAAGNYLGGAQTLNKAGLLADARTATGYGANQAGATAIANRNYLAAAQAFGQAGDIANVQGAQGAQFQQSQMVGGYLQQASPILHQAYAQNGTPGLVHAASLITQELTSAGLMTADQAQQWIAQAGTDPQGTMATIDNRVQQLKYQSVGPNAGVMLDPFGKPVSMIQGPAQTTLNVSGGAQTLVNTPGSITPVGGNGGTPAPAPAAPAPSQAAQTPANTQSVSDAPTVGNAPVNNPGNLRPIGSSTGFMNFATPQAGLVALSDDLNAKAKDGITTLSALANKYAPPGENNTAAWLQTVGGAAGITDPNGKIDLSNPNTRAAVITGIVKAEGNPGTQLSGAAPAPAPAASTTSGATTLASTANGQPLFRPATPAELPPGAVAAQVNSATGEVSNIIKESDVNNLTPEAQKQLGEQYWLTGQFPKNMPRGGGSAAAIQSIQNYAAKKSADLGISGADDNVRHNTVNAAMKTVETMLPQQAQLATAENNAIDNANQIRTLLPKAAATFHIQTLNDLQQIFARETTNPQVAALDTAYKDFTGDYSKVMFSNASGSGGAGGVSDREDNAELFNPDDPIPVVLAKLGQAQTGMSFRTAEFGATLKRMQLIARTGIIPPSSAAQPVTGNMMPGAPNSAPPAQPGQATPTAAAPKVMMYDANGNPQ